METPAFPLVAASKLCLAALNSLLQSLEAAGNEHKSLMPPQTLRNQRDRFKIWAGNLGALQEGRASLDFRLRESVLMQSAVHKLLKKLEDVMKKSSEVVRGVRKPLDEYLTPADEDEDIWGGASDESSLDGQEGMNSRTELGQNTIAIVQIISDLFKLSFRIRNPATRSSGESVLKPILFKHMVHVEDSIGVDLLACFAPFDRGHVEEAFRELRRSVRGRPRLNDVYPEPDSLADTTASETSPRPPPAYSGSAIEAEEEPQSFLVDRWSTSLTNRRRYFAYWESHARKLAWEDEEKQIDSTQSDSIEAQPPTIPIPDAAVAAITPAATASSLAGRTILSDTEGSTYERKLDDEIDASSVVSYASTTYDIDGTVADLPRAPPVTESQAEFQCPFCWVACPSHHAKGRSWRDHILHDLQPYMCTYKECPDADALYTSRSTWLAHETDVHRRVWRCFAHPQLPPFTSQEALLLHLGAEHGVDLSPAQMMQEMVKHSYASTVDQRSACPFCESAGPFKKGFANHMAFHMEQLACFAAPRRSGAEDGASSSYGANTDTTQGVRSAVSLTSVPLEFSDSSSRSGYILTPHSDDVTPERLSPSELNIIKGDNVKQPPARDNDTTTLQAAAENGHIDVVRLLLDRGVDVNQEKGFGRTALREAAGNGHIDVVTLLLDKGANIKQPAARFGFGSALQVAARKGYIDIVKVLLDRGADVNQAAADGGSTALQEAAQHGHIDVVTFLLDQGAEINQPGGRGGFGTALQAAARNGHIEIVTFLLDQGADVNQPAGGGFATAVQAAAGSGHIDVVTLLLDHGADINEAAPACGSSALQGAAMGGHIDLVTLLLDRGADLNQPAGRHFGMTALQAAARRGHIDLVTFLLDQGADVNQPAGEFDGRTALQAAAESGHIDVVRLLLDQGADVSQPAGEVEGWTALQAAKARGHDAVVQQLLRAGASAKTDNDGASSIRIEQP